MEKILTKLTTTRLKDVIKSIRNCKTAAEERAVIAKESAFVRTSFKEENVETRHINVQKLLYIFMLGYPAHFGQMECLKLVASPKFTDKKLGYLGIMLLLDENQEVLTLVTNCLKNDMNNSNMYIVGLALCTLGNISSPEMARDLCGDLEKLLGSSNTYIRKKAALCAVRIVKKVPDLLENFTARAKSLLNDRNHGVLLTGVTLLTEMCLLDSGILADLRGSVPILVRHLKNLVTAGFSPEHDVGGITDPFVQVKILRLMRILGSGDAAASDAMNDVLAQVATNTEASKNVGNAILYETVMTIMNIESENSLRVLGINILGKFLANKDNNVRYVALTTLAKIQATSKADSSALQRHRSTILDCLRDPDITIRRRALDLSFYLINSQNIRILTRELLSFLEVAENEIKASTATKICDYAGRYRPNKRWEIDTVIRVLRVAGAWVDQATVNYFVKVVSTAPTDLQQYAVRKVYNIVRLEGDHALTQEGLLQALGWCVGEFGDFLVVSGGTASMSVGGEDGDDSRQGDYQVAPTEKDVIEMLDLILRGPFATSFVKEYFITGLVKLTSRFTDSGVLAQTRGLIAKYKRNEDMEIQARAVEYMAIAGLDNETRIALLERMPVLESAAKEDALKGQGDGGDAGTRGAAGGGQAGSDLLVVSGGAGDMLGLMTGGSMAAAAPKTDNILDLLGEIGLGGTSQPAPAQAPAPKADLLNDLFGGGGSSVSASKPAVDPLADLFGGSSASQAPQAKAYECYNKNGFKISLTPVREADGQLMSVTATFQNLGAPGPVGNLMFQVAVPKVLKLQMHPPSSTVVPQGGSATQAMRIENPSKTGVKLRLKIGYAINGQAVEEVVDFAGFDPSLWA
ncbi:clathrin associated protein complex large subunit [Chytridiales sp. JEL 0842]|nr:clathrin associated protein complex large subunit [Chytridiales sp. JEL 0842]